MERRFYIGDGPRNNQLVQMVLEKIACCRAAREKLALDFGAVKTWEYKGRITGIAYCKRMEGFPWLTFVRSTGQFFVYCGNTDTTKGRELAQRIRCDKSLYFSPEQFILKTLRVQREVPGERGVKHLSWAFCAEGRICVSIPGSKKPVPEIDPFPKIPYWLEEVSYLEWNALKVERMSV